jgi:hypothetical protein
MPAGGSPPPPPPTKKRARDDDDDEKGTDPILAALDRLAPHFASPAKAGRASALLTRLLLDESGAALRPGAHAAAVLGALCAAAADAPVAWAPGKTPESVAAARAAAVLVKAAVGVQGALWPDDSEGHGNDAKTAPAAVLVKAAQGALWPESGDGSGEGGDGTPTTAPAAAVLDVFTLWSTARADLATDDSFALSAAVRRLVEAVDALPALSAEEENARAAADAENAPAAAADADEAAALADLAAAPARARDAGSAAAGCVAWSPAQASAARRAALLDAFAYLLSPPAYAARPWSRATADAAVGGALASAVVRGAFGPGQAERVAGLQRLVAAARVARGAGRRPAEGGG